MSGDRSGEPVPSPTGLKRGAGVVIATVGLVVIVAFGLLGRFLPDRRPPAPDVIPPGSAAPATPGPAAIDGFRLVSPSAGTVWLRATEVFVRGVAPPDVRAIEAAILADGSILGRLAIEVEPGGRFDGAISIIPSQLRTSATLDLREVGGARRTLASVPFSIEAGAMVLIREASNMQATTDSTFVVDVLAYGRLREVRALLTSQGGTLIARTSGRLPGGFRGAGAPPRMLALELELPVDAPAGRARLHVLGIDRDGSEVEHIDATVKVSSGS